MQYITNHVQNHLKIAYTKASIISGGPGYGINCTNTKSHVPEPTGQYLCVCMKHLMHTDRVNAKQCYTDSLMFLRNGLYSFCISKLDLKPAMYYVCDENKSK